MVVLLGLVVAMGYGTGDFLGGYATRSIPPWVALLGTQVVGAVIGALLAIGFGGSLTWSDVAWSGAAGLAIVSGLACLYRGIARGRAVVVAPIAAAGAAVIQFSWGLIRGEDPGAVALAGAFLAIAAVIVLSATDTGPSDDDAIPVSDPLTPMTEIALSIGAAAFLGVSLIFLAQTGEDSELWPIVLARTLPLPLLVVPLLPTLRRLPALATRARAAMVGAGALDVSATALLLVLVRRGDFSVVAPAAALYPVATVALARIFFGQRIGTPQLAGLVAAACGLALLAAGA